MRIVAILNQKGGVGKTTTAVNLGAALARSGSRVLLIDADSQANLSDHLGVDAEEGATSVYDVLTEGAAISEGVVATSTEGLFVLPANADLAAAEQELAAEMAREFRLRRALAGVEASSYDWVLIDCPPSLGLLSLNAMAAADAILITVQTEYFAMRGLSMIDEVIAMVREHVNPGLRILGILPTLVSHVTRLAREVTEEIRGHYGPLVFDTRIRQNIRLAEAPGHQMHIFDYDPLSAGAADYAALAVEIEARLEKEAEEEARAETGAAAASDAPSETPEAPEATRASTEAPTNGNAPTVETAASTQETLAPAVPAPEVPAPEVPVPEAQAPETRAPESAAAQDDARVESPAPAEGEPTRSPAE